VLARVNVAALGVGLLLLVRLLWPQWAQDPDLAHGFAVPLLFGVLVVESRREARPHYLRRRRASSALAALALLLGAGCVAAAGLYGLALGAASAMTCFLASGGLALVVLSEWMALADEHVGVLSFGWPAGVAVLLWPLSSPLPPGSFTRFSLALQGAVTGAVTGTLGLLNIPAYRDGNVIELARGSVGVSEACSGVRSLLSCVVAGLFLSAVLVRRPRARVLLVILAPVLAVFMNFIRSLALTLVANARGEIGSGWHEGTGMAITGATTVLLTGGAFLLGKERGVEPASLAGSPRGRARRQGALALTLGCLGIGLAYVLLARAPAPLQGPGSPDIAALFPAAPEGWRVRADSGLAQFRGLLRTSTLARKTYLTSDPGGPFLVTLYVAYWPPDQASASQVASHTPDFCWPGSGWVAGPLPDPVSPISLQIGDRILPPPSARVFSKEGYSAHVWFWHLYAGKPLVGGTPNSVPGLLEMALKHDLRGRGDQVLVVVSSNRGWEAISPLHVVREFFTRLGPLGL
jgi:exosortase